MKAGIKEITRWIAFAAALLLLAYVMNMVGMEKILVLIYNVSPVFLIIALVFAIFAVLSSTVRYHLFLRRLECNVLFPTSLLYVPFSIIVNYASPGKIGIIVKTAVFKSASGVPASKSLSASTWESVLDLFFPVLIAAICLLLLPQKTASLLWSFSQKLPYGSLFIIGLPAAIIILFLALFFFSPRFKNWSTKYLASLKQLTSKSNIFPSYAVSSLSWILMILAFYSCILALGGRSSFNFFLLCTFLFSVAYFIGFLSPMPGGLGVRELIATGLVFFGYDGALGLLAMLLLRVVTLIACVLLVCVAWSSGIRRRIKPP